MGPGQVTEVSGNQRLGKDEIARLVEHLCEEFVCVGIGEGLLYRTSTISTSAAARRREGGSVIACFTHRCSIPDPRGQRNTQLGRRVCPA